jgi:hypothetical protein
VNRLLDRLPWRRAEVRPATTQRDSCDARRARTLRLKAPSSESASQLVTILRNHGFPAELRSRGNKVVDTQEPCQAAELDTALRAVQMWLLLDATPDHAKLRWGRRRLSVHRPIASKDS